MPKPFSSDARIERIARGLIDRSLPRSEWTHAGHFAAVTWLLRHRGNEAVRHSMPQWIRDYNEVNGVANTDTGGYHETITQASIRAAHSVLAAHADDDPLHEVLNVLLSGEFGRSDWVLRYWSRARLFAPEARRGWVDPDVRPLPFQA